MLVIRNAQMKVLEDASARAFERRMAKKVLEGRPDIEEREGAGAAASLARAAIEKADRYGIDMEDDVEALLALMLAHGVDFEVEGPLAWARSFLEDRGMSGRAKILAIRELLQADSSEPADASEQGG